MGQKVCLTPQAMKRHLKRDLTLTAVQLKATLPALETISIRTIQWLCHKDLNLPSRKMAAKPLCTQAMKDKRPVFACWYLNWGWWKSLMKAILS